MTIHIAIAKSPRPHKMFKVGSIFPTNNFGNIEIVAYLDCYNIQVKFQDGTVVTARSTNIKNGQVCNPNHKSLFGRGFYGIGENLPSKSREYTMWVNMFHRCYSGEYPSYAGVEVCEEWYNLQNFIKWVRKQPNWDNKNFSLDKDIKVYNNLVYSPNTCSIVPKPVNSVFTRNGHEKQDNSLPTGVSYSSCKRYFQVQWNDGKHHSKYFKNVDEARDYWISRKKAKVSELINKYDKVLSEELKIIMLTYDWSKV